MDPSLFKWEDYLSGLTACIDSINSKQDIKAKVSNFGASMASMDLVALATKALSNMPKMWVIPI